ncbi:RDD family protein [Haloechinothrix salitolerans]|uniref:RDD family protein n=1 Tax=Haloechinothrix salitolerans TaxID=926830 RepID=A0ABW2BUX5_9PSEU
MSDLVTGEAVELDLRHARVASRGLAFAIDALLQFLVLVVLYAIVFTGADVDLSLLLTIVFVIAVFVLVGYPVTCETLTRGRTLGKLALGLRVVRDDGGPVRFRHALVRGLAGFFVDFWALGLGGFVAVIVSLFSKTGKRVGDYLAGTVVINVRSPEPHVGEIGMPPPLAEWASQLDLSRVPDGLALAIRQYLGRFHTLAPESRAILGSRLVTEVANTTGTPCPPGVPPWAYLSAVVAERRNREAAKVGMPTPSHARPPRQPDVPPQPDVQQPTTPGSPGDTRFTPPR